MLLQFLVPLWQAEGFLHQSILTKVWVLIWHFMPLRRVNWQRHRWCSWDRLLLHILCLMHHISMKFERGRWQQIFECDIYTSIYTQPVISSSPPIISFQRFISSFDIFSSHSLPFCQSSTNNIFITMAGGVKQTIGSNVDIVSARTSLFANAGCMLLICFAYLYIICNCIPNYVEYFEDFIL